MSIIISLWLNQRLIYVFIYHLSRGNSDYFDDFFISYVWYPVLVFTLTSSAVDPVLVVFFALFCLYKFSGVPECWCSLFCGLEKKTNLAVNPVLVFFFSFAFLKTNWAVHPEYWCYFVYQFSSGLSTGVYFFTCWVVDLVQVFIVLPVELWT